MSKQTLEILPRFAEILNRLAQVRDWKKSKALHAEGVADDKTACKSSIREQGFPAADKRVTQPKTTVDVK